MHPGIQQHRMAQDEAFSRFCVNKGLYDSEEGWRVMKLSQDAFDIKDMRDAEFTLTYQDDKTISGQI